MTYLMRVCVADRCDEHRHRRHPGQGHCVACMDDEERDDFPSGYTFSSRGSDLCCCRDSRIMERIEARAKSLTETR